MSKCTESFTALYIFEPNFNRKNLIIKINIKFDIIFIYIKVTLFRLFNFILIILTEIIFFSLEFLTKERKVTTDEIITTRQG